MSSSRLFAVHLGIFSTEDDAGRVREACTRWLEPLGLSHELSLIGPEERTPAGELTLAERYEELPDQWRAQYGEPAPASHDIRELRLRLRCSPDVLEDVWERLTRTLCPDPEHASPCPIPWSGGWRGEVEADTDGR
ncbi:hypothetical protein [Streptomyces oceani]|uniref:Uncharacterized protein n=1 Tax=Streptomyces oceani TaxID=1075402 RepID=A0A1E7KNB6_9ACTN|nr:hypothetical protein [Streptomyces oceani]OEV05469.1 hypothetical protein AN216_03130 [Streptomyces oceani]